MQYLEQVKFLHGRYAKLQSNLILYTSSNRNINIYNVFLQQTVTERFNDSPSGIAGAKTVPNEAFFLSLVKLKSLGLYTTLNQCG